jgi:hypothetical protein
MPCYDPPRDAREDAAATYRVNLDRYVACLKDIEQICLHHATRDRFYQGLALDREILDIIDRHFGDRTW